MMVTEQFLARGKRLDNGEWVNGYVGSHSGLEAFIIDRPYIDASGNIAAMGMYMVDPATIGRWTGITDANDMMVYVGDIVRLQRFVLVPGENGGICESETVCIAAIEQWALGLGYRSGAESGYLSDCLECPSEELEVIGNIYDDPELVEE